MTAPSPPAGWYPDPEDGTRRRYWDGATWTLDWDGSPSARQPRGPVETVRENPLAGQAKASGLTISRGVALILLALVFGFIASWALPEGPTHWNRYATAGADGIWRAYFLAMLTITVVALILGCLSLARPASHPVYSVIAGAAAIVVGIVGGILGFLSVGNGDDMTTPLAFLGAGMLFVLGGAVVTLLSAITLADQRRSRAWPPSVALPSGVQPGTLGLRFLARLIDGIFVGIVAVPPAVLAEQNIAATGWFPGLFAGLLSFGYFVVFEVSQGWTPGKKLLGMRVHGPAGAAKPTVKQSAIRNAFTLLAIIPFVGELLVFVACIVIAATIQPSPTKQGKHDQFAGGTQVVKL